MSTQPTIEQVTAERDEALASICRIRGEEASANVRATLAECDRDLARAELAALRASLPTER